MEEEDWNKLGEVNSEPLTNTLVLATDVSVDLGKIIQQVPEPQQFVFEEDLGTEKEVYVIYGAKGDGKTTLALGFPGIIAALSFDYKTALVKKNVYTNDSRIKVYNALKYFDEDPNKKVESAAVTFKYLLFLLEKIKQEVNPDYILIDGSEIFTNIAEVCMRGKNSIGLYAGIANRNLWKERKDFLVKLHRAALRASKKGLIYTTYTAEEEVVDEGTVISKSIIPKWTGIILYEADIVIYTYSKFNKEEGKRFYLKVANSKMDKIIKTGLEADITNKKMSDIIKQ